jgi:hypothetical protein
VRESSGVWEDQVRDTVMGGSYRWGDFRRVSWRGVRDGGLGGIEKDSEDKGEREK